MQRIRLMLWKRCLVIVGTVALFLPPVAAGQGGQRGWVGVAYTTSIGQADPSGNMVFSDYPVIESIEPGSPAERAGLEAGDKILALNSQDLKTNPIPLGNMLQPGRKIVFRFRRNDATREVSVIVAPRPAGTAERIALTVIGPDFSPVGPAAERQRREVSMNMPMTGAPTPAMVPLVFGFGPSSLAVAGAELTRLNQHLRELVGLKTAGVFVVNVAPGTPAMRAGLQSTDVIVRAGELAVENPGEIVRLMSEPGVSTLRLQIIRKKKPQTVTLRW